MHFNEALNVVRHRCHKSGTCNKCPYMKDDICEVRKTLLANNNKPKREKRKKFNK